MQWSFLEIMANPDQKTLLIDEAIKDIKQICIKLQEDTGVTNIEIQSLLKSMVNDLEDKKEEKLGFRFR